MRVSPVTVFMLMAAGVAFYVATCAYFVPLRQIDQRCFWWRSVAAEQTYTEQRQ